MQYTHEQINVIQRHRCHLIDVFYSIKPDFSCIFSG